MKKIIICVLIVAVLAIGIFSGIRMVQPSSHPDSEDEIFANVLNDIGTITVVPHTAGSVENQAVRDMIVSRAENLGLTPEVLPFIFNVEEMVQKDLEAFNNSSTTTKERVQKDMELVGVSTLEEYSRYLINAKDADELYMDNILVKVDGTEPQGTVMFVSHYDHVVEVPGAGDDALAVACMLNLMEKLAAEPPQNDVYFLYTDGEDLGLLGATDFVETQPQYADEVDVLLNFEGRGNSGALIMFESSANDFELVRDFSRSVPQPVTCSVATAIYSMMPNGTDFTEFKNAGYHGLNFAMIDGSENYHRPTDTLENLNKDSAWHYYQTIMALGENFGNAPLDSIEHTQQALYTTLPFIGVVVVPGWLGYVCGFLPIVLAILLIFVTVRSKDMSTGKKIVRVIGLALLGIVPCAVTILLFAGSYLFSFSAILFLVTDFLLMEKSRGKIGFIVLLAAVLLSALLYAPIVYLIQIALGMWYATAILAALPVIPTVVYSVKAVRTV